MYERLETLLQKILIKFPIIIESDLRYLDNEYQLGNSNYIGDILFLDSNNKRLNVEIKIRIPPYSVFKDQLLNRYIKNIDNERVMYIAPKLTNKQREFCIKYNIEIKEIDISDIITPYDTLTTIQISISNKEKLDNFKLSKRESYNSILIELIEFGEENNFKDSRINKIKKLN